MRIDLYFPACRGTAPDMPRKVPLAETKGNGELILVVDDEEPQRKISSEILSALNYQVQAVKNGEEAVAYLKKNHADLLILDMIMAPGMNGKQTYEEILNIRPGQKAIIASGFTETADVKKTQELGAGRYVKKPYTLEKLGMSVKEELMKGKGPLHELPLPADVCGLPPRCPEPLQYHGTLARCNWPEESFPIPIILFLPPKKTTFRQSLKNKGQPGAHPQNSTYPPVDERHNQQQKKNYDCACLSEHKTSSPSQTMFRPLFFAL